MTKDLESMIKASSVLDYDDYDDDYQIERLKDSSAWTMKIELEIPKTNVSPLSIERVIREYLDKGFTDKDIPVGETPEIAWMPRKVDWKPFDGQE